MEQEELDLIQKLQNTQLLQKAGMTGFNGSLWRLGKGVDES